MAEMTVFELSEVADLLDLPTSTVKNWTIGRPLSIKPSIRASRGKGSRNLYSREDVYLLALAVQLTRDGFDLTTVKRVLKELKGRSDLLRQEERSDLLGPRYSALVISSSKGGPEIKFLTSGIGIGIHEQLRADVIGRYVLDIGKLVAMVDEKIRRGPPYRANLSSEVKTTRR